MINAFWALLRLALEVVIVLLAAFGLAVLLAVSGTNIGPIDDLGDAIATGIADFTADPTPQWGPAE
jgi:threonine/homoserine efflux transporter RhtA